MQTEMVHNLSYVNGNLQEFISYLDTYYIAQSKEPSLRRSILRSDTLRRKTKVIIKSFLPRISSCRMVSASC